MLTRLLAGAAAVLLVTAASAHADMITGTYTAVDTGTGGYLPTINDDGGSFLTSPFSQTLTLGTPTTPTIFLQVAPISGGTGTLTGSIAIDMTLLGPAGSPVTSLTYSNGGNPATLSNGSVDFSANYEIFNGNQTDCITWNSVTCTASNVTTTVGETLTVGYADGASTAIALYNWSDWNMTPAISFEETSAPARPVPEPASAGVLASALAGLWLATRRRHGGDGTAKPAPPR
jgi:hypothetical protein